MLRRQLVWAVVLVLATFGTAQAQILTGILTGKAETSDGASLPGATVIVKSPALQGIRSAVTDAEGNYILRGLPPGSYTVTFELTGMTTIENKVAVALGSTARVDATLKVAPIQETVTVTAELPSALETPQVGANYKNEEIDAIATGRTIAAIAELAPGLTDNTPNAGQVTISGAFAYDNLFLIDGVDANDNLFGTVAGSNQPYIESAVEETQIITSGISAEFGRFSGGIINVITKRGGNDFSGSARLNLTNPSWRDETPLEDERGITREDKTSKFYEATFGGPIVKDKLWFFLAGRKEESSTQGTFPFSGVAFTRTNKNDRIEGKLTGTLSENHTFQAAFTKNDTDQSGPTFDFSIAPSTIDSSIRENTLFTVNYTGVLTSKLFAEAQYSKKHFGFRDSGGNDTNIRTGSPFFTFGNSDAVEGGNHFGPPYFDATDPEDRNNRTASASLSYYVATQSFGSHDLKGGFEYFQTARTGGNSQSPSGFVFYADYVVDAAGNPVLDATGNLRPDFIPFGGLVINWIASRGGEMKINTTSFYVNDKWTLNDHWKFNLGARFEKVTGDAVPGDIIVADTSTIVPRVAASYDVRGDGKIKLDATYSHYAGKYNEAQFGSNNNVGNPSYVYALYIGPPGQGFDFAPGFDLGNYYFLGAGFPAGNISFDKTLSSPVTKEWTVAAGVALPKGGYMKAIYSQRKVTKFVEDFFEIANGTRSVTAPTPCLECQGTLVLDHAIYRNTNLPKREYQALQLQTRYRLTDKWDFTGHWTLQLKNDGNYEGEGTNTPGITSGFGDYPEILSPERNTPDGRLNDFQRHKVRAWTTYNQGLGKLGNLHLGLIWRYDSALTFSFANSNQRVTSTQLAKDPGYANPPDLQTVFFGKRGAGNFAGSHLFDVALNYDVPIFKTFKPWVKAEVRNVLNNDKLTSFNTTTSPVSASRGGPVDANGIPTTFTRGSSFGKRVSNGSFPIPREFLLAVGFRF